MNLVWFSNLKYAPGRAARWMRISNSPHYGLRLITLFSKVSPSVGELHKNAGVTWTHLAFRNPNDANDAAGICEAVTRPSMRFVATKSEEQQAALILFHRSSELSLRREEIPGIGPRYAKQHGFAKRPWLATNIPKVAAVALPTKVYAKKASSTHDPKPTFQSLSFDFAITIAAIDGNNTMSLQNVLEITPWYPGERAGMRRPIAVISTTDYGGRARRSEKDKLGRLHDVDC